jgi:ribonuclease Y
LAWSVRVSRWARISPRVRMPMMASGLSLEKAADALSAARPGARREILENYVHRLEKLESIADNFEGVTKSFAIQAGRELRIIVNAEKLSDEQSLWLSKDVARRIESELQYPGMIKVTVIRETRAVDFAK